MSGLQYQPHARGISGATIYPGALLNVLNAGTQTLSALFADVDLSVPLPNPLQADAAGYLTPVYVDPDDRHDISLTDSIGNVVEQVVDLVPIISPLSISEAQPRAADGSTLPLAELTFFLAKTTILADIFAEEALSTPLDNPLAADSSGEFPAIWLRVTEPARVILKDASGVMQFDVEQYRFNTGILPPTAPVLSGELDGDDEFDLSWTASVSQFGSVAGYRLYKSTDGGAYSLLVDQVGRTYDDLDIEEGHTYSYFVIGYDTSGNDSDDSNIVSVAINVLIEIIPTSRTWIAPAGLLSLEATVIGGAGGGASGGLCSFGTFPRGGGGGGGGGISVQSFSAAEVGSSQLITIGAGGLGGNSITAAHGGGSVLSNPGGDGGDTSFGSLLGATGGDGGHATYNFPADGGTGTLGDGGDGGLTNPSTVFSNGKATAAGPGGGGAGGGLITGISSDVPGAGGVGPSSSAGLAGTNSASSPTAGGNGGDDNDDAGGGGGGGGGYSGTSGSGGGNGARGGNGGKYGAGGGGGGMAFLGSQVAVSSGAGGNGHSGVVVLRYTYVP